MVTADESVNAEESEESEKGRNKEGQMENQKEQEENSHAKTVQPLYNSTKRTTVLVSPNAATQPATQPATHPATKNVKEQKNEVVDLTDDRCMYNTDIEL